MSLFLSLVEAELARARRKHPTNINNAHEGKAIIEEEFDEFWDEVKKQKPSPEKMAEELIQTAAMCARTAEDLGLLLNDF